MVVSRPLYDRFRPQLCPDTLRNKQTLNPCPFGGPRGVIPNVGIENCVLRARPKLSTFNVSATVVLFYGVEIYTISKNKIPKSGHGDHFGYLT